MTKHNNTPTSSRKNPAQNSQSNNRGKRNQEGSESGEDNPSQVWSRSGALKYELDDQECTRGRLGKDSSSVDSGLTVEQKHCLVQAAENLQSSSRKHGVHFLGWHFAGHEAAFR